MKKILKNPDGTETVFEGTPEELAELERSLNEKGDLKVYPPGKRSPRKILNESDVQKMIDEALQKHWAQDSHWQPWYPWWTPCWYGTTIYTTPSTWSGGVFNVTSADADLQKIQDVWSTVLTKVS